MTKPFSENPSHLPWNGSGDDTNATTVGAPTGRPRSAAVDRATAGRLTQQLDHRLRGLHAEANGEARVPSTIDLRQRHRYRPLLTTLLVFVVVAAVAVLLLRMFVIQPFSMPGDAMTPTLQAGDRILVLKSSLLRGSIHSGEVIVFRSPKGLSCDVAGGTTRDLALRVVALPGQVIRSVANSILVDGRPLQERGWYDPRFGQVGSTPIRRTVLGENQYFVLADNRSDACDSRTFGPISGSSVVGEGIAVVGRHGHAALGTL